MAETLMTIETEGTVTAGCFSPTNSLCLCYATITNLLVIRKLVGPQEQSESEIDSEVDDFDNRFKPHSEIVVSVETDDVVRQVLWTLSEKEEHSLLVVGMRSKVVFYDYNEENGTLQQLQIIKPKNTISKIYFYKQSLFVGADNGDFYIYNAQNYTLEKTIEDAADYISDMCVSDNLLVISSGDGSVYLYNMDTWEKLDNNATEEFDFTSVLVFNSMVIVGTQLKKVLIYRLRDLALPIQQINFPADIEFFVNYNNFILIGLSNGELHGMMTQPLKDVGILSKLQEKPLLIGCVSHDFSIGLFGGVDNKLFILNFDWLLEDVQNAIQQNLISNYNDGFLQKEENLEKYQLMEIEEEEVDNEIDDPSELLDLSSVSDSSDDIVRKYEDDPNVKVIKPGHLASDSSFSDYFKFDVKDKTVQQKQKEKSLGKDPKQAEKKQFFKDL